MKKIIITLSLVLVLLLASCSSGKKVTVENGETENSGTDKTENSGTDEIEKREITLFAMFGGAGFAEGLPVFEKAEELTGVKLVGTVSKNETDPRQAFNLMLASGDLPEVIAYHWSEDLEKLGRDGGLIPLEDLIAEHAPNLIAFWEENPRLKKDAISTDGHIYFIPNYYDSKNLKTTTGYFIRKDWLAKLGLEEPKTTDDLYEVLKSFKENDPDGNGMADTVPVYMRGDVGTVLNELVDIFKATSGWYTDGDEIKFGPMEPEYKEAMQNISKWYAEGLIDPEVFTRGYGARDFMLNGNLGGFTNDWFGSTSSYNDTLKDQIEGFDFGAILPPSHNGDKMTRHAKPTYVGGWGITVTAEDTEGIMEYMDFWYSDEGRMLWNYGEEGKTYTMVDGEPIYTDFVVNNPDDMNALAVLRGEGAQFELGMAQLADYEIKWYTDAAREAVLMYMENGVVKDKMPLVKYLEEENKTFVKVQPNLDSYIREMSQKWILGASNVDDDWDEYISRLEDLKALDLKAVQQAAYDRFMNN